MDVEELRNALSIIRQRRHAAAQKQRPDFLANVDPKGSFLVQLGLSVNAYAIKVLVTRCKLWCRRTAARTGI